MCNMIFSLKGYTREYMMLQMDGIGVDYIGTLSPSDQINVIIYQARRNCWSTRYRCGTST